MPENNFFDVPKTNFQTSGGSVELPILYREVSERRLNFFVDYEAALAKVEGTGLVPCKFYNHKALASLILWNYRDTSIGPYEEAALILIVRVKELPDRRFYLPTILFRKKSSSWGNMGAYVLELPVTTEAARVAGREIWGYPKFATKIPFKFTSEKEFEFTILDPKSEEPLVSVQAKAGFGITMKGFDLITYSNHQNSILKTVVDIDTKYKSCLRNKVTLHVGDMDHRLTRNLRDLGLDHVKPWVIQITDHFRSRLNPGKPLMDWPALPLPY
ncbi:MAG: acetoacetate decarboxylase family protein [Candidatus Helarchaeota archaeon]|nr:acetoacetate decarboxylase family protein [Candidatus Helarchaeota archaeon]